MWPAKNPGENFRLYQAVKATSEFAIALGVNIPTGKDSLSMTQKYPNGQTVYSPGTVIISTIGECSDIRKTVSPDLVPVSDSILVHVDFSRDEPKLGGSSLSQVLNQIGSDVPDIKDTEYFAKAFATVQSLINKEIILAGHDISSGGLITTLLEMCFPTEQAGLKLKEKFLGTDPVRTLFAENPGILIQLHAGGEGLDLLKQAGIKAETIAWVTEDARISFEGEEISFNVESYREKWFSSSYLLDRKQSGEELAKIRQQNFAKQPLSYSFRDNWLGNLNALGLAPHRTSDSGTRAAIIREKGVNGDREMAYALWLAGFDVKDVHMTDLISGAENLEDIQLIVFVGGFSNSDVLGSAKGWAGAFLYNEKAKRTLDNFYNRPDTLSLGVCNGCQLMVELGLVYPEHAKQPKMLHNASHKFESAFVNVTIPENKSVMMASLSGQRLGVWVAHGEGKFSLPQEVETYEIAMKYSYEAYPGNPNGSDYATAGIVSADGRHLAIMPHIERSLFSWNWPHFPSDRKGEEVSPWIEAFVNAKNWAVSHKG
jgi:phosphoribosylformylglycinamidine synthase